LEALIRKGALTGSRALNRIITVCKPGGREGKEGEFRYLIIFGLTLCVKKAKIIYTLGVL